MSNSLQPQVLYSAWDSPGQNIGVGSHSLLQGIFPTQGPNLGLLHCRQILYQLSYQENSRILEWIAYPSSSRSSWSRNRTGVSCIASRFFTSWATNLNIAPILYEESDTVEQLNWTDVYTSNSNPPPPLVSVCVFSTSVSLLLYQLWHAWIALGHHLANSTCSITFPNQGGRLDGVQEGPLLTNCWRKTINFVQWWLFILSDHKLYMSCFFISLSSFSLTLTVKLTTFWASFCCHSEKHICLVVNLPLAFTS